VEAVHPSYQVWSYKCLLEDFNETIYKDLIKLFPCAYLHNYKEDNIINNVFYSEYISKAPIFLKSDASKLRDFIKQHIKYGDSRNIIYRIDSGKIKPSKNLSDELNSMLSGNEEFIMIDSQKVIYETILEASKNIDKEDKQTIIVSGGPGTGKSVLAINLLVKLINERLVVKYITRNSAPREVYEVKLTGSFKKSHISNLFGGSGSFHSSESNEYSCLIIDEAHRLNEKSGMFSNLGENQIKEIINASQLSVFFIDEDQKVTLKDIGDIEEIEKWARYFKSNILKLELDSQFRCNGSEGYISWLDNIMQIRDTARVNLKDIDYDFKVIDSPEELHKIIRKKNKDKNKSRLVAGYCWDWVSKKNPELRDIVINNFSAKWNLDSDGQSWIIKPNSVNEVGCIHTCQGLEVDYVGVIIGEDLVIRNGIAKTYPEKRAKTDRSISGWKKLVKEDRALTLKKLDSIIKNTYRVLMTRGQKGCYIYCVDKETHYYFKKLISNTLES
jgi:DUF2075 family protein/DNA replication protein DnaC